jgi:hypothetical protein
LNKKKSLCYITISRANQEQKREKEKEKEISGMEE